MKSGLKPLTYFCLHPMLKHGVNYPRLSHHHSNFLLLSIAGTGLSLSLIENNATLWRRIRRRAAAAGVSGRVNSASAEITPF